MLYVQIQNRNKYYFLNCLGRSWTVVESAGGHKCNPNGILGLLCREHFPGIVEYDRVTSSAYSFDHYVVALDAIDQDGRTFNNKAERVSQELWVSLSRTILFNTSYMLHILEIMNGFIVLYA
jgi:hypothetical protein